MNTRTVKQRGFTLIELLVVIAIIGILSSMVLAALSVARNKGHDTKVKSQLTSLRSAAELYYTNNGDYASLVVGTESAGSTIGTGCNSNIFISTEVAPFTLAANYPTFAAGTGKCTSNGSAYAVTARLNAAGTFWCVDSVGKSKQTSALQANSTYVCP